ncbi:MarR family winged helix-turn-helix transcriptional regulator [Sphingorhabdus contaminans]|jgi:DNA-binding MarR family transcriptional regulator|uniref:MarR family transcriptional regulator n=1 Tax=Sphingorhabdus contaminans TaxID=1343899 RepID=A0A553W9K2_9SPHN|nr:MarR family transcriptional regulator [Sphingorhabdus contaminans]TSB01362.1 MarR family transcriptional regulator [Sphingorhabdus contaminans]
MPNDQTQFLLNLTRAYHLLGALSDQLHSGHGLSTATRSILTLLEFRGPLTLSEIARDRAVSRQFIQKLAGSLLKDGFVTTMPNPASKRSPKLQLTASGRQCVADIFAREQAVKDRLAKAISHSELQRVNAVLAKVNEVLTTG